MRELRGPLGPPGSKGADDTIIIFANFNYRTIPLDHVFALCPLPLDGNPIPLALLSLPLASLGFPTQWAQMERTNKTAIHEQKIKCAYLPAEDGSAGANGIPEENEETQSGEPSRIEDSVSTFTEYEPGSCSVVELVIVWLFSNHNSCPLLNQSSSPRNGLIRCTARPHQ